MIVELFVVIDANGRLRRNSTSGGCRAYESLGKAKRWADRDGDAVVVCPIDLDNQPLFIRSKTL